MYDRTMAEGRVFAEAVNAYSEGHADGYAAGRKAWRRIAYGLAGLVLAAAYVAGWVWSRYGG